MIDKVRLGWTIEEALNDYDETELLNVINSMTHAELVAVMELMPEHPGGVYSLTVAQWEEIASKLQGKPDA